jgi:CarboxypepD_reg-like domain/TonB-dependent Receptor Plug Domain
MASSLAAAVRTFALPKHSTMSKIVVFLLALLAFEYAAAQNITQTIRGTVVDKESKSPIHYATVMLLNTSPVIGSTTDSLGNFVLQQVPIGRQSLQVTFTGYKPIVVSDIQINSAKEVILTIELEELATRLGTVTITAGNSKSQTVNEMIGVSGRTFSTAEANRFAGSQNDPSRMARNYAGVSGASDQRNDIIIRGNSPQGLLWRIDGLPVPNPNHFAGQGSTGGPISIINYKLLSNSDFITGAFPAEYGNATSGVFDIKMRNGNDERMERTLQVGALGLEALVEGPFSKKNGSSYVVGYRYSTLSLLAKANVNSGFASIPTYQDLSFKFNFVTQKAGIFRLFGLGGISSTDFLNSKRDDDQFSPANKGENVHFGSKTGIAGLSHTYFINQNTYVKSTIGATYEGNASQRDTILADNTTKRTGGFGYSNYRFVLNTFINKKINAQHTVQAGILAENINFKTEDSLLLYHPADGHAFWGFNNDFSGSINLLQAYAQWKYKLKDRLILNSGMHFQYLLLNNKFAAEPRLALNYFVNEKHVLSVGVGLHNQAQPWGMYFFRDKFNPSTIETNKELDFTQSAQVIIGYDFNYSNNFRIKAETYYQQLTKVPVETSLSSYSVLNYGATFYNTYKDSLVNTGTGYNYGLELTAEKFFSNNYYFLLTTSLFQSKYKGSDGVERNTAFNSNYVVNVLGGYEFNIKKNFTFLVDVKMTIGGGLRYTPLDAAASIQNQEATYQDDKAFTAQNSTYFKPDLKLTLRKSFEKRIALEWAVDFQNVANHKNVFLNWYDKNTQTEHPVYQNGFFPTFQFKLEF